MADSRRAGTVARRLEAARAALRGAAGSDEAHDVSSVPAIGDDGGADSEEPSGTPCDAASTRTGPSLKARAIRLLSMREHSRAELARKLAPHAASPDQLEQLLDALQADGWQSTERYVASVLHRRAPGHGVARLRQELQFRGVDASASRDALEALSGSETQRAQALWARRFGGQRPADARERARQTRFLLARGFSAETVRTVLRLAQDEVNLDPDTGSD